MLAKGAETFVNPDNPRVEGLTHTIVHPGGESDVPWIKVRSQRNADGSESHVWERWVAFSAEPLYLALFARWDPGMIVRRHGHYSPHTLTVLAGEFTCDGELCGVGTHLELPLGASFGPLVAGPEGVELYEVMMGDPRSWSDEPEVMVRILEEHGVEQLPDPPIDLPAGLEDLRAVFSAGASPQG
ncbi:MAG: hypothetical protein ACK5O2_08905 [Microthrixaceae bacterium]